MSLDSLTFVTASSAQVQQTSRQDPFAPREDTSGPRASEEPASGFFIFLFDEDVLAANEAVIRSSGIFEDNSAEGERLVAMTKRFSGVDQGLLDKEGGGEGEQKNA